MFEDVTEVLREKERGGEEERIKDAGLKTTATPQLLSSGGLT